MGFKLELFSVAFRSVTALKQTITFFTGVDQRVTDDEGSTATLFSTIWGKCLAL
jgi:hypothetical protein